MTSLTGFGSHSSELYNPISRIKLVSFASSAFIIQLTKSSRIWGMKITLNSTFNTGVYFTVFSKWAIKNIQSGRLRIWCCLLVATTLPMSTGRSKFSNNTVIKCSRSISDSSAKISWKLNKLSTSSDVWFSMLYNFSFRIV